MMLRVKLKNQVSQRLLSQNKFILSRDMNFMSRWRLHHMTVNQVDAFEFDYQ